MTSADVKALEILRGLVRQSGRPVRCVELGEVLWPAQRRSDRQAWCRPAGRVLRRLQRALRAEEVLYRRIGRRKAPSQRGWVARGSSGLELPAEIEAWQTREGTKKDRAK